MTTKLIVGIVTGINALETILLVFYVFLAQFVTVLTAPFRWFVQSCWRLIRQVRI